MKTKVTVLFISIISIAFTLNASNTKVEEYTLDNGLTVILCENHDLPSVFGGVIARVGSKDDPADATGLAHYMEHMLFKGTTQLGTTDWESEKPYIDSIFAMYDLLGTTNDPAERDSIHNKINDLSQVAGQYAIPNELDDILRGFGSTMINAGTAPDWTAYFNQFPPSQIQKWIEVYAHRFEEPVFRLFQSELETVYEEKNMYEDYFFQLMLEEYMRNLFKVHPYGQQTALGTTEHLKNPSLTRMKEFYDTWYVPGNMALILIGDIDPDQIKPMIETSFGKWEAREFPEHLVWDEKPIEGREHVEVKMSPIKMALLGFKTIPGDHPDKAVLDVCNYLISNQGQTGLTDKLVLDNQLMAVQMITWPTNDLMSTLIFVVPKLVGQKLEEAEELVLTELKKLQTGDFSDELMIIAKNELERKFKLDLEDRMSFGMLAIDQWYFQKPIKELYDYPKQVNAVTKADIQRFANEFFGDNYLAFYSKMGSPDKEKIDKPGYDPVEGNTKAESEFAIHMNTIPAMEPTARFVDFESDFTMQELSGDHTLIVVKNPENDVFSIKIKYGIGELENPKIGLAAELMNYATPSGMSLDSLKKAFAVLGCTYNFSADENYAEISLTGFDKQFAQGLALLGQVIFNSEIDEKYMDNLLEMVKTNRKSESEDAEDVADALLEYAMFGSNSTYINRPSAKKLKKLSVEDLKNEFEEATQYQAEIHYSGTLNIDELSTLITDNLVMKEEAKPSSAPFIRDLQNYSETSLIIVDKPKASQSKIFFFAEGENYTTHDKVNYDAFNFYFGGGFSGLVVQEIREYRSLAYSAGARYKNPPKENEPSVFYGYVGTQDDKTIEAVDVFLELTNNMPEKSERMDNIREFLIQAGYTARPHFRDISTEVIEWQHLGYNQDPNEALVDEYKELDFEDIVNFYKENIQGKPISICIVGDKKRMDVESLSKYGEIKYVKEKALYTK